MACSDPWWNLLRPCSKPIFIRVHPDCKTATVQAFQCVRSPFVLQSFPTPRCLSIPLFLRVKNQPHSHTFLRFIYFICLSSRDDKKITLRSEARECMPEQVKHENGCRPKIASNADNCDAYSRIHASRNRRHHERAYVINPHNSSRG